MVRGEGLEPSSLESQSRTLTSYVTLGLKVTEVGFEPTMTCL